MREQQPEMPGMTSHWVADRSGASGMALALGQTGQWVAVATAQGADGSLVGACCCRMPVLSGASMPSLVWMLPGDTPGLEVFTHATHVSLNLVLEDVDGNVTRNFSGQGRDRFAALAFEFGLGGAPLLEAARATFECENWPQGVTDAQGRVMFTGVVRRYRQAGAGDGAPKPGPALRQAARAVMD